MTFASCDQRFESPSSSSAPDSTQTTPAPPHTDRVISAPSLNEDDLRAYAALAYDFRKANTEAARRAIQETGMSVAVVERINALIEEVANSIQAESQARLDELRVHAAQGSPAQSPRATEPSALRVDSLLFGNSASESDAAIVKRWLGPLGVFVGLSDKQKAEAESLRSAFAAAGWNERESILWSLCRRSDGPYPVGPIPEIHASLFHPGIRVRAATELRHSIGLSPMSVDTLIDAASRANTLDADYEAFCEAAVRALSRIEAGELVARLANGQRFQSSALSLILARAALLTRGFNIEEFARTGPRERMDNAAASTVAQASTPNTARVLEDDLKLISASADPELRVASYLFASALPSLPPWMADSLVSAMADEDRRVRNAAVAAASSLRGRGQDDLLVSGLASTLQRTSEQFDRTLVLCSLVCYESAAMPTMLKEFQSGSEENKLAVLAAIAQPRSRSSGAWLEVFNTALTDPSARVRREAFILACDAPQDFGAGELESLWVKTVAETRAQLDEKLRAGAPITHDYWRDDAPFVALPPRLRLSAQQRQAVTPELVKLLKTFDGVRLTGNRYTAFGSIWSSLCRCGPESVVEVETIFRDADDNLKDIMLSSLPQLGQHAAPLVPMLTTLSQRRDQLGKRTQDVLQLLAMAR